MKPEEILQNCGYEHGKDQVVIERLNLKSKKCKKPKSIGKFVKHKSVKIQPVVNRSAPNIDLLDSPDYVQSSFIAIHKDHRGFTK